MDKMVYAMTLVLLAVTTGLGAVMGNCACTSTTDDVTCTGCDHIPLNLIPTNTTRLYMTGNDIPTITPLTNLTELEHINMVSSNISQIQDNAFADCGQLQTIFLTDNLLSSVSPAAFTGLKKVEYLALGHNRIIQLVQERLFSNISDSLMFLDMSHNAMFYISPFALNKIQQVL